MNRLLYSVVTRLNKEQSYDKFAFSIVKAFNRGCKPFLHFFVKKIFGLLGFA